MDSMDGFEGHKGMCGAHSDCPGCERPQRAGIPSGINGTPPKGGFFILVGLYEFCDYFGELIFSSFEIMIRFF